MSAQSFRLPPGGAWPNERGEEAPLLRLCSLPAGLACRGRRRRHRPPVVTA